MNPPGWLILLALLFAVGLGWWVAMKDALRKTAVILYDLEPDVERAYDQDHGAFSQLRSCARIWHIEARGDVRERKYHAGAGAVVKRNAVILSTLVPLVAEVGTTGVLFIARRAPSPRFLHDGGRFGRIGEDVSEQDHDL